ncbi:MAG: hypothetical protein J07HQX50_00689 [Haloquadratum sp. J07HQX50]|jgi:hypothetical protein|nr:MAG: hypothetical protein J07HQX50_00689 [Haloquadratum sp. J07HQX50]
MTDENTQTETDADTDAETTDPLPESVIERAVSLTHRAQETADSNATNAYESERDELLAEHEYRSRIRTSDDTLVLYPSTWIENGDLDFELIDDTSHAVERSLGGVDTDASWEHVEELNAEIVERIRENYANHHVKNIRAFADFMSNHYLKQVTDATSAERDEFITEYYPRNVWATETQAAALEESLALLDAVTEEQSGVE